MTLQEIQAAVESGKTVFWKNKGYVVVKDAIGQWLIKCRHNDSVIGLTWQDGVTLNGKESEFHEEEPRGALVLKRVIAHEVRLARGGARVGLHRMVDYFRDAGATYKETFAAALEAVPDLTLPEWDELVDDK